MVNMGELFAFDRLNGQPMELVPLNDRELEVATLQVGDLLFARSSLKIEGTGKCSIVIGLPDITTFESHLIRARLNVEAADSRFYFYYFQSHHGRSNVLSIAKQVGAAGLAGSQLATLVVPNPRRDKQARIAEVLWAYDDLIENNRRRMALLEEAARQLYREWFVRLRFPGHEHTRMTKGVPEGWEPSTLGDLCEEIRESVKPEAVNPESPYIGLEHMPRRSIALTEWGTAEEVTSNKHRFREGEILFGKIRPYFHKVGVAFVDGVASSDAIIIRANEPRVHGLVLMTVSSDPFVAVTAQTMREGSKMPRADWKQMQQYKIALPPEGILTSFNDVVQSIVSQLKTLTFSIQKLRAARDLLLPRLMSGEVTV
ncbi:MAG TPA: restriction endonuclease subunit S [Phycisphaerales bacterium]|nr:restriction endonuclease subunit S [Phycisphaerales bacterium]